MDVATGDNISSGTFGLHNGRATSGYYDLCGRESGRDEGYKTQRRGATQREFFLSGVRARSWVYT